MEDKNIKDNCTNKEIKKKSSFYLATGICILAIGVAAFTAYGSIKEYNDKGFESSESNIYLQEEREQTKNLGKENSPTKVTSSSKNMNKENPSSSEKKSLASKNKEKLNKTTSLENNCPECEDEDEYIPTKASNQGMLVHPAGREIIKPYSNDKPIFSKTLNDWRVHNGVDYKAPQGSVIKAITNGIVKEIYEDQLLGTTICIEHEGNFFAYYSGLGKTTLVKVGKKVEAGEDIASINDIPAEAADGPHLHLCIKKDGKYIDPCSILP